MEIQQTILTHQQIQHKIRRIAYQIYETNVDERELILAGIASSGYILAQRLEKVLKEISDIEVKLCKVIMDKKNPLNTIETSLSTSEYFKTAVLVNRNHKKYPIKADFKGVSLSTSLLNHVEVEFGKQDRVCLK